MSNITEFQIAQFIEGYLTAALWSSNDTLPGTEEDENPEVVQLDDFEFADGVADALMVDCKDFIEANAFDLLAYAEQKTHAQGYDAFECAGHDFWLTRNNHGAGFWDRGLGELGDRLTAASESFGSIDLYLGDDEFVYASGL